MIDPIKLAVKECVLTNPRWASQVSRDRATTEIFNRITTPMGRLLKNILTLGLYEYFTKRKIQRTLLDARYQPAERIVTFHSDRFSSPRKRYY